MSTASIGGELAFKIESIHISEPYNGFQDLTFKIADGNFLHICGENNIVELLEKALEQFRQEECERTLKSIANSNSLF